MTDDEIQNKPSADGYSQSEIAKVLDKFAQKHGHKSFEQMGWDENDVELTTDVASLAFAQGKLAEAFLAKKTLEKNPEMTAEKLVDKIYSWHRRDKDGDGCYACLEMENANITIISEVYEFDDKGNERVIPKEKANEQAKLQKCYVCEYLRRLKSQLSKKPFAKSLGKNDEVKQE
jgi:hypothetical protein